MFLWDQSSRRILSVLMSSTARKFYTSEIVEISSLSWPTVSKTLASLVDIEVLIREDERLFDESAWRAPRVYYSLSPEVIDYLRL
jgi:DNA-binding transcriptional ArsR family regulator